ncbi:MAG: hypothetical protein KC731_37265, partial [Myxococcales bacterium]|nr:hypothetical protein [Myxococcales bacterium]
MRPFVSLVALAGLPGLLGGCFPPVPSAPLAEIASHPADRVPAAALVPGESLALVMAPSVTSLFTTLHRDALAEVFAEPFERARYELVQALRVDLLSLGGLVDLGIDPEGPVALGLLPGQAMVVAFELRRPDRLQTALYREGRRPRVVEGAVVVPLSDRVAAAVQGDHALVVVSEDAASAAERLFDATTPRLRDRPSFRRAMARLQGGGEGLTAYVDLRALLFMQLGLDPVAGRTPAAARVNLEAALREALRARATEGASAADLLAVERRFERRRARLRDDERARLLRHLLGDLDHAACSLVVHDADARLRVSLDLPAESPLRRVLAAAPEPGPLLAPLAARPALRAALGIDAAAVLEELEGLGEVIERPRWLAPWLRLAAPKGFALALAPPSESEAGSMPAAAMLVEVGDPAAVTTIFDAMVAKGTLDRDGEE